MITTALVSLLLALPGFAQEEEPRAGTGEGGKAHDLAASVARGVEILLDLQESLDGGDAPEAEWPYEGVYRKGGKIAPGYRVGGTSIAAWALIETPAYASSGDVRDAVERGTRFVLDTLDFDAMAAGFYESYDVRGWGHTYALNYLLRLRALERVPAALEEEVDKRITWLVDVLQEAEIEGGGGWNYARRSQAQASIFMTAPTLLALYEAERQGEEVDAGVVERGLDALERGRVEGGWYAYTASGKGFDTVEGAIGRTPSAEVALALAGRRSGEHCGNRSTGSSSTGSGSSSDANKTERARGRT